jgi:hypothetical protein
MSGGVGFAARAPLVGQVRRIRGVDGWQCEQTLQLKLPAGAPDAWRRQWG